MKDLHPTDPRVYDDYTRVATGNKPHMQYICRALGISEEEYQRWLLGLFFILNPMIEGQPNFYDEMLRALCGNRDTWLMVHIFTYSKESCLLPDTGFTTPGDDVHEAWSFNLTSRAFVTYSFSDIERFYHSQPEPKPPIPAVGIDSIKNITKDLISIQHYHDRLDVLSVYNQRVVLQGHEHVYGARKTWYGVN